MLVEGIYLRLIDSVTGFVCGSIMSNHNMSVDEMLSGYYDLDNEGQLIEICSGEYVDAYYDNLIVKRDLIER